MTAQELIQRWDAFLNNIETRFNESLQHAEEACLEQIEDSNYDYFQTIQVWMGIKAQIQNLYKKIETTWEEKVSPQMEDFEEIDNYDERDKGTELDLKLYHRLEDFNVALEGKVSQKYYDHAIAIIDKDFHCSQCNAKLEVVKNLFRSQYVTCSYCDTVNTFEPDTKFKLISSVIDNILNFKFQDQQKELAKMRGELSGKREKNTITEKDWENYKNAYMAFHELYFNERIKLNLSYKDRFKDDMERKLLDFENYKKQYNYGNN